MFSLKEKKILVTGSSDGLGKLLAIELAKAGAEIIVHGRESKAVNETLAELHKINKKAKHGKVICDLSKPASLNKEFSHIKELDILVNNAGVWTEGATIEVGIEKIIELMNVNLTSYLLTTRILLPILSKSDFAQILNVISVAGYEVPQDYFHTIYSATKFGLQGFSEAMAKEFQNKDLRVMGFYPGGMATGLFKKAGIEYKEKEPWMFDPIESVESMIFMLTRNPKVSIKRLDLINHLYQ